MRETPKANGRPKDPIKTKAVAVAAQNGISKRTVEVALAKASDKPKPKKVYVTCPECSAKTSALEKHMEVKHARKKIDPPADASNVTRWVGELDAIADDIARYKPSMKALRSAYDACQRVLTELDAHAERLSKEGS